MVPPPLCAAVHKVDQNNVSWVMTAGLHFALLVSVLCGDSLPLGGEVSGNNKQCWAAGFPQPGDRWSMSSMISSGLLPSALLPSGLLK